MDPYGVKRRLTCILAADAAGFSGQMGEDEEGTVRVLSAHRAVIDGIIAFHDGRIMHTAGDSVLAEFSSAVEAVRCAVEIQDALKTRNDALPEHRRMLFRLGVNLGDVVVKNDDLLGDGVNVAARLEGIAEPGGICISSSVYDQITGKLDLGFLDIGEQTLKNISRPIRVFRVSGTAPARTTLPVPPAPRLRKSQRAALIAVGAVAIAAVAAWQAGWLHFGQGDAGSPKTAAAPVAAPSPALPAPAGTTTSTLADTAATRTQSDAERLRAEAEALKRQAEAELARARSEVDAGRAARTKTDAEAAAAKLRGQAEADAVRIRADAEATAARTRSEADTAARAATADIAKATQSTAKSEPARNEPMSTRATAPAADSTTKVATVAPGGASSFDGTWNVTIVCSTTSDGALGYTFNFPAQVKDGFLHGDQGIEGSPGWLRLQGQIQPDGSANFNAHGLVGDAKYAIAGYVKGAQFGYTAVARFEGSRGTGRRVTGRACDLSFVKQ